MEKIIDLRSDTVTVPTEPMRQAMFDAIVGDSVMGDDPTVLKLEKIAANLFNKEAALFLASGTMANQVAVLSLTHLGDQVIIHEMSHMNNLEVAGLSSTCGVQVRAIPAPSGRFDLDRLQQEIHLPDIQRAPTTLICLENTFDLNKGLVVHPDHYAEIRKIADNFHIPIYLDGARVFNAAIALNKSVAEMCESVDAVGVCLTKGLGCPVGSLLMGSQEFINRAIRMRQRLGGGWRQAGVIAAAGIVGLEQMIDRISDDHKNARLLATGLIELGLKIDLEQVQTNIINVELPMSATVFYYELQKMGVKVKIIGNHHVRLVTHKDFPMSEIDQVISKVEICLRNNQQYIGA